EKCVAFRGSSNSFRIRVPPDDASPRKSAALSAARNAVNVQVLMRLVRIDNQMKSGKVPPCPSGFATAFGEQKQREPRCTADLTGAAAKRPASPVAFILPTPTCASLTAPRTPTALERKAGHRNLLQSPARQYAVRGLLGG